VAALARKIAYVLGLQLLFLSATWLAGIYVNGFVPILPGESTETILLNPAVESHVILASLSAATSVFILALAWASGSRRLTALTLIASLSIVLAGDSGLAFILGGGSDSAESMIMASAFVTALFLTFLSMASLRTDGWAPVYGGEGGQTAARRGSLALCYAALVLFYAVFITGIYVNLFVAGPIFSLPLNSEPAAFARAESTVPFIGHEVLGLMLLAALVTLVIALWVEGAPRLSAVGAVPALLVGYSAYVGSMNLTSTVTAVIPGGAAPFLVPMLSATGLIGAIVITMLLTLRVRADGAPS
jgi:hypothetical protein